MLQKRRECPFRVNYFDNPNIIAIYRRGKVDDGNTGCIAVLSNDVPGEKEIDLGKHKTGQVWKEITGSGFENIVINEDGKGLFKVEGKKISVWIPDRKQNEENFREEFRNRILGIFNKE